MSKGIARKKLNGEGLRIGIVATQWNQEIVGMLRDRCKAALIDAGVQAENIVEQSVSGAYELPFAAQRLAKSGSVDAVVPIGVLVKGETMHFEYIADAVSHGLMRVGLDTNIPIVFGVLTCLTEEQAEQRATPDGKDHGYEWGQTAIEMALLDN